MASSRPKKRRAASTSTSRKLSSEKTRSGGQWTEARFRSFVTSALRGAFRRWQPKYTTLKAACVGVRKNPLSGRDAKHYLCVACGDSYPQKNVQVDHKEPIGPTTTWDEFIEKLFCEADNLQVLCKPCHKIKSAAERKATVESKKESGNT
jgi:5-methylcytosine-specific restriction endonuclease McrA